MRELTLEELELISGGSVTTEIDEIVVVGDGGGDDGGDWGDWGDWGDDWYDGDYGDGGGGDGGGDTAPPEPPADTASVDVDVQITRPLTASEQQAVNDLKTAVAAADAAIRAIPDNARVTLTDGTVVTGAELKDAWSKTDFQIVENGTPFANGSGRGEADWNGGDPVVRSTIGNLEGYNAHGQAGMNYLVLHELAHFAEAQRNGLAQAHADGTYSEAERLDHERDANDIARAIANQGGIPILTGPGDGYSPSNPGFTTPPPPSGGGGGGGGGGGNTQLH